MATVRFKLNNKIINLKEGDTLPLTPLLKWVYRIFTSHLYRGVNTGFMKIFPGENEIKVYEEPGSDPVMIFNYEINKDKLYVELVYLEPFLYEDIQERVHPDDYDKLLTELARSVGNVLISRASDSESDQGGENSESENENNSDSQGGESENTEDTEKENSESESSQGGQDSDSSSPQGSEDEEIIIEEEEIKEENTPRRRRRRRRPMPQGSGSKSSNSESDQGGEDSEDSNTQGNGLGNSVRKTDDQGGSEASNSPSSQGGDDGESDGEQGGDPLANIMAAVAPSGPKRKRSRFLKLGAETKELQRFMEFNPAPKTIQYKEGWLKDLLEERIGHKSVEKVKKILDKLLGSVAGDEESPRLDPMKLVVGLEKYSWGDIYREELDREVIALLVDISPSMAEFKPLAVLALELAAKERLPQLTVVLTSNNIPWLKVVEGSIEWVESDVDSAAKDLTKIIKAAEADKVININDLDGVEVLEEFYRALSRTSVELYHLDPQYHDFRGHDSGIVTYKPRELKRIHESDYCGFDIFKDIKFPRRTLYIEGVWGLDEFEEVVAKYIAK